MALSVWWYRSIWKSYTAQMGPWFELNLLPRINHGVNMNNPDSAPYFPVQLMNWWGGKASASGAEFFQTLMYFVLWHSLTFRIKPFSTTLITPPPVLQSVPNPGFFIYLHRWIWGEWLMGAGSPTSHNTLPKRLWNPGASCRRWELPFP